MDAAEAQNKHVILVNPLLKDIPSSAGVMQVRGRKERMAFEDSFAIAYHFRLLYLSSQCIYPVMGALRKVYHHDQWQVRKPPPPLQCHEVRSWGVSPLTSGQASSRHLSRGHQKLA